MDNSRRSLIPAEDSITMYLSFDTEYDDTLPSKWQSGMSTQTSQYLETQSVEVVPNHHDTLEKKETMKSVLDALKKNDVSKDQFSPLRPFDKQILTKHNALSSTPAKTLTVFDVPQNMAEIDTTNKENTQPEEQNSTLSATINATALTVKANAMIAEENNTIHENTVKEPQNKSNVYPLSENVVLENITEVSNDEPSISVPSPLPVAIPDKSASETTVNNLVNEVSQLFGKALKLTEAPMKTKSPKKLSTLNLPRPRRSYLPSTGATIKQRMSIIVKTTLNSPARKLALGNCIPRRSGLPAVRASYVGCRKSFLPRRTELVSATTSDLKKSTTDSAVAAAKPKPIQKFNCTFCSAYFCEKRLLDMHMDSHSKSRNRYSFFCKYCDKKFMIERALHIHLMQHCDKIPPSEKRKLEYTELNHVKKAKLPKLIATPLASNGDTINPIKIKKTKQKIEVELPTGRETLVTSPVFVTVDPVPQDSRMAPPSVKKVLKKVAHAGVCRTPTKSVPCHICKLSFKNILDYTTHCLTVHSKNKKENADNALSAQDKY